MIIFKRTIMSQIENVLFKGKVIILYGPRQVGKTTLVKEIVSRYDGKYFSCEEPDVLDALTHKTSTHMRQFLGSSRIVVLDEAQKVPEIGTSLKLLHDTYPEMQIIATGSSSFDLANKVNEPLTGRNFEFHLYPLSMQEIVDSSSLLEAQRLLETRMIYGGYPEIVANPDMREMVLGKLTNDYLYQDILSYEGVRKPHVLKNIVKALALQVGSQVSYSEVASIVGVSRTTVVSYVDILEKAFVLFRLYPLTSKARDEIKHMHKIYFYDTGVLNALINNYNPLSLRSDAGHLFENFFIAEKIKQHAYSQKNTPVYFWRTKHGQEIDFVEEYDGGERYVAYECKLSKAPVKMPAVFRETYGTAAITVVSKDTILESLIS